jgi:hypothetical protein
MFQEQLPHQSVILSGGHKPVAEGSTHYIFVSMQRQCVDPSTSLRFAQNDKLVSLLFTAYHFY